MLLQRNRISEFILLTEKIESTNKIDTGCSQQMLNIFNRFNYSSEIGYYVNNLV